MTLSTRAEHEAYKRADAIRDGLQDHVRPMRQAREYVADLEGTPENPAVVTSPEAHAAEVADDVARDARRTATDWGDGAAGAQLAEGMGDRAGGLVLELLRESPCIEVRDDE